MRISCVAWWVLLVVIGVGCGGGETRSSVGGRGGPESGAEAAPAAVLVRQTDTAVVVDGSAIGWDALRGAMVEAGGAMVLEELVLDRALEREAARRGMVVGEEAVRAEEAALMDELVGAGENRVEVLGRVRRSRGLGPVRYEGLLRRNAVLRALVRDSAAPSAAELELARRLAFGESRRVRLFVAGTESAAAEMRAAVLAAPGSERSWVFADRAAAGSAHPSAARGGLIERFHPEDPAYPGLLGTAARALEPGGVSAVLSTAAGFAVVMVEAVEPGRAGDADEIARVERRVRQRKERLAMEALAGELIGRSRVSPVDPGLARAWRERR